MPSHEILCRDALSENIKLYLTRRVTAEYAKLTRRPCEILV